MNNSSGKVANYLKRGVFSTSYFISLVGAWAMVGIVLLTVANVILRRALNMPIKGAYEIVGLFFCLLIFLMIADRAVKDSHVIVDLVISHWPKRQRLINAAIIYIFSAGISGVASWQLWMYAMRVQRMGATVNVVNISLYPFVYIASFGFIMLTLVYLIKFFSSFTLRGR